MASMSIAEDQLSRMRHLPMAVVIDQFTVLLDVLPPSRASQILRRLGKKYDSSERKQYKSQVKSFRSALVLPVQYLPGTVSRPHSMKQRTTVRTFSLADVKSALVTRIRRSRRARRPASVQTALMSAPERSSFAVTNSSRSTSSARFIREVCSLEAMLLRPKSRQTNERT